MILGKQMLEYKSNSTKSPHYLKWTPLDVPVQITDDDFNYFQFRINGVVFKSVSLEMQQELDKANAWLVLQQDQV